MMNRLFEIAVALGEIARVRLDTKRYLVAVDKLIADRSTALIPEGGWPGSNADTRKAVEKSTLANDPELKGFAMGRDSYIATLDDLELKRDALLAERSAWEWTIRDREACAHEGGQIYSVFSMMEAYRTEQEYAAQMEAMETTKDTMAEATENMNGDELDLLTQTHDDDPPFLANPVQ